MHSNLWPVGSEHLKVWVCEFDVIAIVEAPAFVTAAAGTINDIATMAINRNFTLVGPNLFN